MFRDTLGGHPFFLVENSVAPFVIIMLPFSFCQPIRRSRRALTRTLRQRDSIDIKITNIRRAIEDGLTDADQANSKLQELLSERESLSVGLFIPDEHPQIDSRRAMEYRRMLDHALEKGTQVERKQLVSQWVGKIELAPEQLEVEITYKIPEPVMIQYIAGDGFEPPTFGL